MDSNSTRGRSDRLQLSVLLDASLVVNVRSAARSRGMTIAAFVERALEVELDGYVESGAGGVERSSGESLGVRPDGGRVGESDLVSPDDRRGVTPDWGALLAAGRAAKHVPVRDTVSQVQEDWTMEIA